MQKIGSILDYSYPGISPDIWLSDGTLNPVHKDFVLKLLNSFYNSYGLKSPEQWVIDVTVIGSLTTNRYIRTSDFDCHVIVNIDKFIETNMPNSSKEEAIAYLDNARKTWDRAKILMPFGEHVLELYIEDPNLNPSNTEHVGRYSMFQNKWLKDPIYFAQDLDFEESRKEAIEGAKVLANELDDSFGEIGRQIQRIDELKEVLQAWPEDKRQLYYAKVQNKLDIIEEQLEKSIQIKQDLVDQRHLKQDAFSENEIQFKFLARFHYFSILQNLKTLLEQTGGTVTTQELPLIEKIISQGVIKKAVRTDINVWIDPNGKIYKINPSPSHKMWVYKKFIDPSLSPYEKEDAVWNKVAEMFKDGWTRVSSDSKNIEASFVLEVLDLKNLPSYLDNFISQNYEPDTTIELGDSSGKRVMISDPFPSIQKAVNKALSQKRMGSIKEAFLKEAFEENKECKTQIAIDFDGTIAKERKFPDIGEPEKGVKEALSKLKEMGYDILIYSCRSRDEEGLELIREYLDKHEIPYDSIFEGEKPFAKFYIDNRAIHFDNWNNVLKTVEKSEKKASSSILKIEPYGGGVEFPVIINPSRQQVANLLPQCEFGELRVIQGNNTYVWDASKATHEHVLEYLAGQGLEEYSNVQTGYVLSPSDVDEFSWGKRASLFIVAAQWPSAFWVDPNGKIYNAEPTHDEWIRENKQLLKDQYGIDIEQMFGNNISLATVNYVISKGWTRVAVAIDGRNYIANVYNLRNIPTHVIDFLLTAPEGAGIVLEDKDSRNYVTVSKDDLLSGQKGINRAILLQKNSMQNNRISSTDKKAGYAHAYWLDPNGKIYPVRGEDEDAARRDLDRSDQNTHSGWILRHLDLLEKEYGIAPNSISGSTSSLVELGWTRIGDAYGTDWGIDVSNTDNIPSFVDDAVAQFAPEGAMITVAGPGSSRFQHSQSGYTFEWPVRSIQQTVQQLKNRQSRSPSPELQQAAKLFSKHDIIAKTKKVKQGDYSCLMALVPHDLAQEIVEWGVRNVPDEDLYLDEDGKLGRELESHITIKYGLLTNDAKYVRRSFNDDKPFHAKLGKVRHFQPPELPFDVLTVEVISEDLQKANAKVCDSFECVEGLVSDEYKPHITIAYMKRDKAHEYVGYEGFDGKEVELDTVIFSPHKGNRTYFSISNDKESRFILEQINKTASGDHFLPSFCEQPANNEWQFEHGGDDEEIALQPDSVSDETTWYAPCTEGKPRTKEVWRAFISMFKQPFSKKEEMKIEAGEAEEWDSHYGDIWHVGDKVKDKKTGKIGLIKSINGDEVELEEVSHE